jgi:cysteine desulfurase
MKKVYLDHASATPVRREALEAMLPYFAEAFENPSSVYDRGFVIKAAADEAREKVASLIHAKPKEVVFTSSGAESNNLAIKGAALANLKKGRHIIVSAIEHHSVLNSARYLERFHDFEVTFLPVTETGLVDPERLRRAITDDTVLVSIMHGNNEIGTLQSVAELSSICREKGVLFHTDAVATVGQVPVDVGALGVDLLSLSGPALGAPKGTGALFFRDRLRFVPLIHGGIQENGRRAGTENVPGIVALGKAAELAQGELDRKAEHLGTLRHALVEGVLGAVPRVHHTGHPEQRLPGHASFCFEGVEGEALIFLLAQNGVYASTGSACASKALKTSPVLIAIGMDAAVAQGSVVFTLGPDNTLDEVTYTVDVLAKAVDRLRSFSPVWRKKTAA